jgi:hypothetical protein
MAVEETVTDVKPKVKLTGTDGNVFALSSKVASALKRAGQHAQAAEFMDKVFESESYDAALQLMMKYVEVS